MFFSRSATASLLITYVCTAVCTGVMAKAECV